MRSRPPSLFTASVGVLVLLTAASCTDELARTQADPASSTQSLGASHSTSGSGTPSAAPVVAPPVLDPDFDPAREAALKRSMRGEARPAARIDTAPEPEAVALWPTLAAADVLDPEARDVLAATGVPVLLPAPALLGDDDVYRGATATRGDGWYALSVHAPDGLHVALHGNRVALERPELAAGVDLEALQVDGRYLVSRAHGIVTVSWRAFGEVAYTLDVECPVMPLDDPRCAADDFALSLADSVLRAQLDEVTR